MKFYGKSVEKFIPALLSFGPIIIVLGSDSPSTVGRIISFLGAFALSLGCLFIFTLVKEQDDKIAKLQEKLPK